MIEQEIIYNNLQLSLRSLKRIEEARKRYFQGKQKLPQTIDEIISTKNKQNELIYVQPGTQTA